jgi:hypothetical protein
VNSTALLRWSGLAAAVGGALALILVPLAATAYYSAHHSAGSPPFWVPSAQVLLAGLLDFAPPGVVYNTYGRLFPIAYLLFIPGVIGLNAKVGESGGRGTWGYRLLLAGLFVVLVAVFGDYWGGGWGWPLQLPGFLLLLVGAVLYGLALLRAGTIFRWPARLLVLSGPGGVVLSMWPIHHWPSALLLGVLSDPRSYGWSGYFTHVAQGLGWVLLGIALQASETSGTISAGPLTVRPPFDPKEGEDRGFPNFSEAGACTNGPE